MMRKITSATAFSPGGVAMLVVHLLEVIDVDHQHGQRLLPAHRHAPDLGHPLGQELPVVQTGQGIALRQLLQAAIGRRQLAQRLVQILRAGQHAGLRLGRVSRLQLDMAFLRQLEAVGQRQ